MLGNDVGAYGLMRDGEVVTDLGGASLTACVSGEEIYRDGGGEETLLEAVGEVGEAGPGNGEERRRVGVAALLFPFRSRSISACS